MEHAETCSSSLAALPTPHPTMGNAGKLSGMARLEKAGSRMASMLQGRVKLRHFMVTARLWKRNNSPQMVASAARLEWLLIGTGRSQTLRARQGAGPCSMMPNTSHSRTTRACAFRRMFAFGTKRATGISAIIMPV